MTLINTISPPQAALRPPDLVMKLDRMGASWPTRLSFGRTLIRKLAADGARMTTPLWDIDADGYGRAVLQIPLGGRPYSLVAITTPLDPAQRSDRVIAEAWDAAFVLFDGRPTPADLDRIAANAPLQEAGRYCAQDLSLSRANKSLRMFDHVVERLAAGEQPDRAMLETSGYLMRTTAVYGNGKFGLADRALISRRRDLTAPFQAEMLTVWLIRAFTHLLVEHLARARSDAAATLAPEVRRHLGVGNATGLGMAPFLVTHPVLLHNWMHARETALARVRAIETPGGDAVSRVLDLLARAEEHVATWRVDDADQSARIARLECELPKIGATALTVLKSPRPWDALIRASADWSLEAQELLVALLIEPYGALVDDLAGRMDAADDAMLDPGASLAELTADLQAGFAWALKIDLTDRDAMRRFWYISEEKLEPRIGDRFAEPGAELETPLGLAVEAQALATALASDAGRNVADLVTRRPDLRRIARRAQTAARHPYSEIRDNLLAADCRPIDLLRSKLAYFGASKFDPKSDLWTRITLFQGAPAPDDLRAPDADDWAFPALPAA